jgi:tetratricopeptide (TPR) repeat protein
MRLEMVVLSIALLPGLASAQSDTVQTPASSDEAEISERDERARMHFDAGRSHYADGAYDRALPEFERAWELSQRPPLLLNVATTLERLGRHADAAASLRRFLELEPSDPQAESIGRRIANLERLAAEHPAPAQDEAIAPPRSGPPPAPPAGPDGALLGTGAALLGVAAAAAIAMGITGGLALSENAALEDGCGATLSCTEDDIADASTYVLVTDIMIGVAAGTAAIGVALLAVAFATAGSAPPESAAIAPWVTQDGAGIGGSVRW